MKIKNDKILTNLSNISGYIIGCPIEIHNQLVEVMEYVSGFYEPIKQTLNKQDELLKEYRILNDLINDYGLTNVTVDKQQRYIKALESELC